MTPAGFVHIQPAKDGKYFWHKKSANGEITATSGSETFDYPTDAKVAVRREFGADVEIRVTYRDQVEDDGGD